jgi:hypothetical protein
MVIVRTKETPAIKTAPTKAKNSKSSMHALDELKALERGHVKPDYSPARQLKTSLVTACFFILNKLMTAKNNGAHAADINRNASLILFKDPAHCRYEAG